MVPQPMTRKPAQHAGDAADEDRPDQQPDVGRPTALPQDPHGQALTAGPRARARSAGRRTAQVEVQQRSIDVMHDPAQQRVAGMEIRPEDPQAAVEDHGHGDEDDRRDQDASCESAHWGFMAET